MASKTSRGDKGLHSLVPYSYLEVVSLARSNLEGGDDVLACNNIRKKIQKESKITRLAWERVKLNCGIESKN